MTRDVDTLVFWTRIFLGFAAFFTTTFPLFYALSPWHETRLGRALMLQGIAFAFVLDMTFIFTIWEPTDILIIFWVNMLGFAAIACTTAYLTWKMLKHNVIIPLQNQRKEQFENE